MKSMPIYNRFIGSIKDKVLIMILFFATLSVFQGCSKAQTRSFTYVSLFIFSPSDYSYIKPEVLHTIEYGYLMKYSSDSRQEIIQKYEKTDVAEMVKSFDLSITFSFIILNVLYYLLTEIFYGASIGKKRSNGRLVDIILCERISNSDAFKRALIGGFLMLLAVFLRFLFDTNYIFTIIIFFLIIDISVFFRGMSLIDILSKTTYVEYIPSTVGKIKANNEIVIIDEQKANNQMAAVNLQESATTNRDNTYNQRVSHTTHMSLSPLITSKRKAFIYIYLIWVSLNIIALALGVSDPHRVSRGIRIVRPDSQSSGEIDTSGFFPLGGGIDSYDFSEFIVYTIAIPLFIFATIKLYRLFVPSKTSY